MVSASAYLVFLALIALQRLAELVVSRRHARWAFDRGGVEYGRSQLAPMVVLHGAFLISCAAEVLWLGPRFVPAIGWPMLAIALAAQALRLWSLSVLGPYWNTRVIVVPGMTRVTDGPYRYLRHPNYLAVVLEGIAIPLVHGAWGTALLFSVANAFLLARRIRCEELALARAEVLDAL